MVILAFAMRFCTATMGAKNKSLGSPPALAYAVTRASGFTPCAFANASDVTTSALAPSFKPGAFPGVTVPSFSNDGLSAASVSSELAVARLDAAAHPVDVVRGVGHRFHTARHDALLVARPDRLGGEHHGLEPRPAHLVDGERGDRPREAGVDRRLPARRLAHAALEHVPHDHFLDRAVLDPGAPHGLPDHERAEPGRGQRREPAEVLADRRPTGAENDGGGLITAHLLSFHPSTPDLRPG